MRRVLLLTIAICIALTSCVKPDDIRIGDITGINVLSASEIEVKVDVMNKSSKNFTLRDMKLSVMVGDTGSEVELIQGILKHPIVLERRYTGELVVPVRIRFGNMMSSIAIGLDPSSMDNVYVVGYAVIKTGLVKEQRVELRKKIEPEYIKEIVARELELDLDELKDIFNL